MQQQIFIGRQPIVNKKEQIIGYEFFFRNTAESETAEFENNLKSCANVLLSTIDQMQDEWRLGDKVAFINVNELMLNSELLELMPPEKTALEILSSVEITDDTIARCAHLKSLNYKISLDNPQNSNQPLALIPNADFVKVDFQGVDEGQAINLFMQYSQANNKIKMVAEKLETLAQYNSAKEIGYHCYQGYYFEKPETLTTKVINPAFDSVLNILNLIKQDADNNVIEEGFKRDATLSYKLLRYINSVGFGLSCEVQSLSHAFSILGRDQLYRWLTLLMVTAGDNATSPVLMKTSITRGKLTELLGESYFEKQDCDNLFVVGVFSLLEAILKVPMSDILEKLQLPETVVEALMTRDGIYGPFLKLTEACEDADTDAITTIAASLQLDAEVVNQSHIEALAWTESLGIA